MAEKTSAAVSATDEGVFPRVIRLKEGMLSVTPEICVERASLVTESYRETESEPIEIRRARGLEKILKNMKVFILDDELIVGHQSEKHRCPPVYPETNVDWIYDDEEWAGFETRLQNRLVVPEGVKETLREIADYWQGKTLYKKAWAAFPESVRLMRGTGVLSISHEKNMFGHCIPDWGKLLRIGFEGLRKEVLTKLKGLDLANPPDLAKYDFLRSLVIVINASTAFIWRYSTLAKKMAKTTANPKRREELDRIGEVCWWISKRPARSFHEALQLLWFAHLICTIESDGRSVSYGRFDQYMYPYYRKDMDVGNLTPERAQELLDCWWIKPNEIIHIDDREHATFHGGYPNGWNLVVGGMTPQGSDATNELSYMCLQAHEDVRLFQPNFGVRLYRGSPERLWERTCEVIALGAAMPQVFNDEVIVQALMRYGLPIEEARNYTATGCVEHSTEATWIRGNGGWINMAKAVEFTMNNGKCALTGRRAGLETGDATQFLSYEEFEQAVRKQLSYSIKQMVIEDNILDRLHAELVPELTISLLIHDCIDKGTSAAAGGARYNFTSPMSVGVATIGDSLAAVKKLVFEEKRLAMQELQEALTDNFEGKEPLRQMLMNRAPKYGNDDDYVDSIVVDIERFFVQELNKYRSPREGTFRPGFWTILAQMTLGRPTGATPDGRKASEPLSDSIGPTNGRDRADTTAVLCSAGKIDQTAAANGTVLNLRLSPAMVRGEGGLRRMEHLIRSYFDLRGSHVAINVLSTETLRDAQKNPDRHRDLLVKVAGYAAFFVELGRKAQNEIITRTEHS